MKWKYFLFCFFKYNISFHFWEKREKMSKTILWKKNFMLRLQQLFFFFSWICNFSSCICSCYITFQDTQNLTSILQLELFIIISFNTPSLYLLFVDLIFVFFEFELIFFPILASLKLLYFIMEHFDWGTLVVNHSKSNTPCAKGSNHHLKLSNIAN